MDLRTLRYMIGTLWLIYTAQILTFQFYDPTLASPILHLAKVFLDRTLRNNMLFYAFLVFEATLIIYSCAALWFGYKSGKITFMLYLLMALIDNYFVKVQAFSWVNIILGNLYFLILGMLLMALLTAPLKNFIQHAKPFHFWKIFSMFFLFFLLYFAMPLTFSYLLNYS